MTSRSYERTENPFVYHIRKHFMNNLNLQAYRETVDPSIRQNAIEKKMSYNNTINYNKLKARYCLLKAYLAPLNFTREMEN